jgi:type I restriction-modification system DNA methylase subunit
MLLTDKQKQDIIEEFNEWKDKMYADKTLQERQDYGQFFTPPELTIQMLEKFQDLDGTILDPAMGAANLLAAAIMAGADPKNIYGIELDSEILKIGVDRLSALGVPSENIHLGNALNEDCYHFDKDYSFKPDEGENGTVYINGKPKNRIKKMTLNQFGVRL